MKEIIKADTKVGSLPDASKNVGDIPNIPKNILKENKNTGYWR